MEFRGTLGPASVAHAYQPPPLLASNTHLLTMVLARRVEFLSGEKQAFSSVSLPPSSHPHETSTQVHSFKSLFLVNKKNNLCDQINKDIMTRSRGYRFCLLLDFAAWEEGG